MIVHLTSGQCSPTHNCCKIFLTFLVILLGCWRWLYGDSVYQRRKAEYLINDLKSFPFALAGFPEVQELAIRHGGVAIQQFPFHQFPYAGVPSRDAQGRVTVPFIPLRPTCNSQHCDFESLISPPGAMIAMHGRAAELLQAALSYLGIRSWALYSVFRVKAGKLETSMTTVTELRHEPSGPYVALAPFGYEVDSVAESEFPGSPYEYSVGFLHVTGSPAHIIRTRFAQVPYAPVRRAFDIDVQCLAAVWRSCRGLDELAPSAWADYAATRSPK
jgi:hypothetical protein